MIRLSDHGRGAMLAATGVIIVSPDGLLVRLIQADEFTLTFWRGLLSASVLFVFMFARAGRAIESSFRAIGWKGLLAALLSAVGALLFIMALKRTAVANVLIILGAEPLCAAVLTALLLKERIRLRTWLAAVVVVIGLTLVLTGSFSRGTIAGDLLAFGGMACVAARYVLFRAARQVDMVPSVVIGGLLIGVVLAPLASPFSVSGRDILLLLLMGAVLLPAAQLMLVTAPRYLPAPEVALIALLEAVLGPIWVWAWLGEVPARETMLGGGLIIGTLAAHSVLVLWRPPR